MSVCLSLSLLYTRAAGSRCSRCDWPYWNVRLVAWTVGLPVCLPACLPVCLWPCLRYLSQIGLTLRIQLYTLSRSLLRVAIWGNTSRAIKQSTADLMLQMQIGQIDLESPPKWRYISSVHPLFHPSLSPFFRPSVSFFASALLSPSVSPPVCRFVVWCWCADIRRNDVSITRNQTPLNKQVIHLVSHLPSQWGT